MLRLSRALLSVSALPLFLLVTGCSQGFFANAPGEIQGGAIHGTLYGGEQPVVGAKVYLYAAGTSGYNTFSRSMLTTNGGYVTSTGTDGHFSITGDYTCQTGDQVYLVATGGNPGLSDPNASNPALTLMAALGACSSLTPSTGVIINEVTTVAAAYALSGFMTSPTAVASANTTLAKQGVTNAFLTASNLVNLASGQANVTTPAGNGVVPQATLNTLANIIAACVNSDGTGSSCSNLFQSTPNASNVVPTNVAQSLINIAHNPGQNAAAIYSLITAYTPFVPTLAATPSDWTMAIKYTGGGMQFANSLAIDATGNVWVSNFGTVTKLDPTGAPISPSTGFAPGVIGTYGNSGGTTYSSVGFLAVSPSGQVWTPVEDDANYLYHVSVLNQDGTEAFNFADANPNAPTLGGNGFFDANGKYWSSGNYHTTSTGSSYPYTFYFNGVADERSSTGSLLSGTGFTGGGLGLSIIGAADASGNVWFPGWYSQLASTPSVNTWSVAKFTSAGAAVSPSTGYTGAAFVYYPLSAAVDRGGNFWSSTDRTGNGLFKWSSSGVLQTSSTGYGIDSGLNGLDLAIDGDNRTWFLSSSGGTGTGNAIGVMSNTGTLQSPAGGYVNSAMDTPESLRIDQSGNIWVTNGTSRASTSVPYGPAFVLEFVGLGSPTVVPLSYAVSHSGLGNRP